jgi:aryl-alcohol dehydrogenase-like predicted oxidoreductase
VESQTRNSVLSAISDDYESLELILDSVHRHDDPTPTAEQVSLALAELVKDGLAQAYELSPEHPHATAVNVDPDRIEEQWFYATPKGIASATESTTEN